MKIDVFTLFPDWFDWFGEQRHVRNALELGHELDCVDMRATTPLRARPGRRHALRRRRGMVIRVDVVEAALRGPLRRRPARGAARPARRSRSPRAGGSSTTRWRPSSPRSPSSRCSAGATRASTSACTSTWPPTSSRSGRYVLAGGELAAMVVCDAVLRKLPGALGHEDSAVEESFSPALEGAPEYPHYTRPAEWRGHGVPEILLSGDHGAGPRVAARAEPRARRLAAATERARADRVAASPSLPLRLRASGRVWPRRPFLP